MLKDMDKVKEPHLHFWEKGYVKIAYRFVLAPRRRCSTFTDALWRQRTNQKHVEHKCSLRKVWLPLHHNTKEEENPQDLKIFKH